MINKNKKEREEIQQKLYKIYLERQKMEINNNKRVQNLKSQLDYKNQEYNNLNSKIKQMAYKDNLITNFLKGISEENIKQKIKKLFQEHLNNNSEIVDKNIKSALIKNENFIKKINEWKDKVIKKTIKNFINETNHINIIL